MHDTLSNNPEAELEAHSVSTDDLRDEVTKNVDADIDASLAVIEGNAEDAIEEAQRSLEGAIEEAQRSLGGAEVQEDVIEGAVDEAQVALAEATNESNENASENENLIARILRNVLESLAIFFSWETRERQEGERTGWFASLLSFFRGENEESNEATENTNANPERRPEAVEASNLRNVNELDLPPERVDYYGWSIEACQHYNIPPDRGVPVLFGIFENESSFNTNAMNDGSSATGLGQFVNGTWESFIEDQGAEMLRLGIATPEDLADPRDEDRRVRRENPELMIYATAWYTNRNFQSLERNGLLNHGWYEEDIARLLMICHHQGGGDGKKYIRYLRTGDESWLARMSTPDDLNPGHYDDAQESMENYVEQLTIS